MSRKDNSVAESFFNKKSFAELFYEFFYFLIARLALKDVIHGIGSAIGEAEGGVKEEFPSPRGKAP